MKKTSFFVVCVLSCLSCRHVKKRGGAISVLVRGEAGAVSLSHAHSLSCATVSLFLSLSLSLSHTLIVSQSPPPSQTGSLPGARGGVHGVRRPAKRQLPCLLL